MMVVIPSYASSKVPDIKKIESSTYIQAEDHVRSDDGGGYNYYGFPIEYNGRKWVFSNQLSIDSGRLRLNNHIYLNVIGTERANVNSTDISVVDGINNFKIKSAVVAEAGFLIVNYETNSSRFSLFTLDLIEDDSITKNYIQHSYLYIYDSRNKTMAYIDTIDPQIRENLNSLLTSRRVCMLSQDDYKTVKGNIIKFSCTQNELISGVPKKINKTILEVQALDEKSSDGKYFKVIQSNRAFNEKHLN